jgi:hypothetical protein
MSFELVSCSNCNDTGLVQLDPLRTGIWGVCTCDAGQEMSEIIESEASR